MDKLIIKKDVYIEMIEHGRKTLPNEACGFLSGNDQFIYSIWPLHNEAKSRIKFFVSEKVVRKTLLKIEQLNERVLAIYHTHPLSKPIPSKYDIEYHADEAVKMVIVSYRTKLPVAKCYRIRGLVYEECLFLID